MFWISSFLLSLIYSYTTPDLLHVAAESSYCRCAFHMFVELQQQGQMAIFTGYAPYCNLHSVMCSNNAIFVSLLAVSRFF